MYMSAEKNSSLADVACVVSPILTPWMILLTVRYGGTVVAADTWSETAAVVLIHR